MTASLPASPEVTDALRARLAVEPDPTVQMILVVAIAQHERERDLAAEAEVWARRLWSDPASPMGVRLGAVLAWLGLTPAEVPPELRTLIGELPEPETHELLRRLPWVWYLGFQDGALADWWRDLPDGRQGETPLTLDDLL